MILIPTKIIEKINFLIEDSILLKNYTEKQKNKLKRTLISLWYFIYLRQLEDDTFSSFDFYTNIHNLQFSKFRLKVKSKSYNHPYLLRLLVKSRLIFINDKFKVGFFSKAYKINSKLISSYNLISVEIDSNLVFKNIKNKKYWLELYPEYKNLIENSYNTKIDIQKYIIWLNNNIGIKLKPKIKNGVVVDRYLTKGRVFQYVTKCLRVNFENLWFKVSDSGRFYSNVVSLPSSATPFLKLYNKKNLVSLDVANCQPLLLATQLNSERYKKDVEQGVFYQRLADILKKKKSETKMLCFRYLFFSNKPLKSGILFNAMQSLYPLVIEQINKLRQTQSLSFLLQSLESDIMIEGLAKITDLKMITRHDEVLCFEEHKQEVENLMRENIAKIGLDAKIKSE